MRPVLKTALRRLWRDHTTLQFGVRPERAVLLRGVGDRAARLIAAIDGTRDVDALRATAAGLGLDAAFADRLLALLVDARIVDDAATSPVALARLSVAERDRLAPDLASISLLSATADGGLATLAARRRTRVGVVGAGRVGASAAALLAAAGVGHVVVDDDGVCAPADCAPGGASVGDVGASRSAVGRAVVQRASGSTQPRPFEPTDRPDLVILAPRAGVAGPRLGDQLLRDGVPHLLAGVNETTAVVGPLVVPGESACLRCLDLRRTDRDPAWPLIAAQLAAQPSRAPTTACDVALASLAASVTALQALSWIDAAGSPPLPATFDGTLEVTLPDWRIRRRAWSRHPACGCHWSQRCAGGGAAG
jgi:bacteriocin biosynthesis cyclodehydratase domain-containing protein